MFFSGDFGNTLNDRIRVSILGSGLTDGNESNTLGTDPTDSDACVIDSQLRVASDANLNFPGIMNDMDGDGDFVFDPARGLIYDDSGLAAFDEAELELISEDSTYALSVQITRTGRIKICSTSDDKKVPRFETCTRDIL